MTLYYYYANVKQSSQLNFSLVQKSDQRNMIISKEIAGLKMMSQIIEQLLTIFLIKKVAEIIQKQEGHFKHQME